MKKLTTLVLSLALSLCLLGALTDTAHAGDLDLIRQYDVVVTPNVADGSLDIEVSFQWEVLEQGPVTWLQIGIPNGSIRETEALTDNIASLDFDNSYMYVYFDRGYDDGEVIEFSYRWTQEYMYTLSGTTVTYDYTPGWFDEARVQCMTLMWNTPEGLSPNVFSTHYTDGQWEDYTAENGFPVFEGRDLGHGAQLNVMAQYENWPTELLWENSKENLPQDDYYFDDDFYYDDDYDYDNGSDALGTFFIILIVVIFVVIRIAAVADGYAGGFGTRYVLWHGLWYPAGPDGRPRPNSVGTRTKPQPPKRSGGFGGGSRGGGFGGGGFGGGGHCACASSCACACACACAGGGRAGCSAKNLYGSVQLSQELTEQLRER